MFPLILTVLNRESSTPVESLLEDCEDKGEYPKLPFKTLSLRPLAGFERQSVQGSLVRIPGISEAFLPTNHDTKTTRRQQGDRPKCQFHGSRED